MKFHRNRPYPARYSMELPLRYKAVSPEMTVFGSGRTALMSSVEITVATDQALEPGMKTELAIAWPALLDDHVRLQLVVCGVVARIQDGRPVVGISSYHYRTRKSSADERGETATVEIPRVPAVSPVPEQPLLRMHA